MRHSPVVLGQPFVDSQRIGPQERRTVAPAPGPGSGRRRAGDPPQRLLGLDQQRSVEGFGRSQVGAEANQSGKGIVAVEHGPAPIAFGHELEEQALGRHIWLVDCHPHRHRALPRTGVRPNGGGIKGVAGHQLVGLGRERLRFGVEVG